MSSLPSNQSAGTPASSSNTGRRDWLPADDELHRNFNPSGTHLLAVPAPTASAYTGELPTSNRAALYDWAPPGMPSNVPPYEARHEPLPRSRIRDLARTILDRPDVEAADGAQASERNHDLAEIDHQLAMLRDAIRTQEHDLDHFDDLSSTLEHEDAAPPEPNRSRTMLQEDSDRRESTSHSTWTSQGTPQNATQRLLRYFMDRERRSVSGEERSGDTGGYLRPHALRARTSQAARLPRQDQADDGTRQRRVNGFRREYLAGRGPSQEGRIIGQQHRAITPAVNPESLTFPPGMITDTELATGQFLPETDTPTLYVENSLHYMNALRECMTEDDSYEAAVKYRIADTKVYDTLPTDTMTDLSALRELEASSWLQNGIIFDGHQYASTAALSSHQRTRFGNETWTQTSSVHAESMSRDHPPGSTYVSLYGEPSSASGRALTEASRHRQRLSVTGARLNSAHNHWPVRVIIHKIFHDTKILHGTMEAYNVPHYLPVANRLGASTRARAGSKQAPITTFVEGHIIDQRTHSFLTPSAVDCVRPSNLMTNRCDAIVFPHATSTIDAANWRKLPPFNQISSEEEMARMLLSKEVLENWNEEYIFMRWKEKCFIHSGHDECPAGDRGSDRDQGHGLTISGFYYVSMSRQNGTVEGLYFDPDSTPYQYLRLTGNGGVIPAIESC